MSTGTEFCKRHPQEEVSLTCGSCRARICTVCLTLTGEGPRCEDCMEKLAAGVPIPNSTVVEGVVLPAGETFARADSAKQFYYATEKDVVYCARHPQTETLLKCGRCDTPMCPRCMIHADVGIRCPDCAANPQRTVGAQAERAAAAARGINPPKDTGFRNYWHKNQAYVKVEPKHYVLATLVGLSVAVVLGVIWGFFLNANPSQVRGLVSEAELLARSTGRSGVSAWVVLVYNSVVNSLHLIPEIALGVLVSEAIGRVTQNRVGPGLQIIAGVSVLVGLLTSILTVSTRMYANLTGKTPSLDAVFSNALQVIGQIISNGSLVVLLFWAAAIFFAAVRLKR